MTASRCCRMCAVASSQNTMASIIPNYSVPAIECAGSRRATLPRRAVGAARRPALRRPHRARWTGRTHAGTSSPEPMRWLKPAPPLPRGRQERNVVVYWRSAEMPHALPPNSWCRIPCASPGYTDLRYCRHDNSRNQDTPESPLIPWRFTALNRAAGRNQA
jgi:hypothetical protein